MPIDPEGFKARDAASYDGVADRFAYWTGRVTSPLAQRLVELADLKPGERVLDVGTGSGVVALAAAEKVGLQGQITGVDLSPGMLEKARLSPFAPAVSFHVMDAEHLDFPEGVFDAVLSLFAVLHFPDPESAVREMFRVTKPGGRVAIGVGGGMPLSPHSIVPALTRIWDAGRAARGKLLVAPQESDQFIASRLPKPSEHEALASRSSQSLEQLLRKAGFSALEKSWHGYTHPVETPAQFWDLQTTFSSVVRKRLESAPEHIVETLRREFSALCEKVLDRGGHLIYRNAAIFVRAVRPENRRL